MPRYWHDRHAVNKEPDPCYREFYRLIVADRKPYFMRYIYPALMKQYNTYISKTDRNALREFQMTVSELKALPSSRLTERQKEFLFYFDLKMPVGVGGCVMNRICRRFEEEFDGYVGRHNAAAKFDYTILKSEAEYTKSQYYAIRKLYEDYNNRLQTYSVYASYERLDKAEAAVEMEHMTEEFVRECEVVCQSGEALCNIVLDLCYQRSSTKRFAWSVCGEDIIHNLLKNNGHTLSFPHPDPSGDIEYGGQRYMVSTKKVEENS